eukprot:GEMP01011930.1.p1 GENE.GEMP01011930.1~~GEMP01011930.1.p1  ORF type:complete len:478 (+),score=127.61 GEMP01011930.1:211-1644(+)
MESYAKMVHATLAVSDARGGWVSYFSIVKYMQDNFVQVAESPRARMYIRNAIKALVEQGYVIRRKHSFKLCMGAQKSPSPQPKQQIPVLEIKAKPGKKGTSGRRGPQQPAVVRKTMLKKKTPSKVVPTSQPYTVIRRTARPPARPPTIATPPHRIMTQEPVHQVQPRARSASAAARSKAPGHQVEAPSRGRKRGRPFGSTAAAHAPRKWPPSRSMSPPNATQQQLVHYQSTNPGVRRVNGVVIPGHIRAVGGSTPAAKSKPQGNTRVVRTVVSASAAAAQRQQVSPLRNARVARQAAQPTVLEQRPRRLQSDMKKKGAHPLTLASVGKRKQVSSNLSATRAYFKTRKVRVQMPQAKARLVKAQLTAFRNSQEFVYTPRPVIPLLAPVPGARQSRRLANMPPRYSAQPPVGVRLSTNKAPKSPKVVDKTAQNAKMQPKQVAKAAPDAKQATKAAVKKPAVAELQLKPNVVPTMNSNKN